MTPMEWFLRRLGGSWPKTYLAFDVETTGLDPEHCYVWQVGHALVEDGAIVDSASYVINWLDEPIDMFGFEHQVATVCTAMRERGSEFGLSLERLRREGHPPARVFEHYYDLFVKVVGRGGWLVGHNGLRLDRPFLHESFKRVLGKGWPSADRVLDTLAIERMLRYAGKAPIAPRDGEELVEYQARLTRLSGGYGGCRLSEDLAPRYDLYAKYKLDPNAHDAGHDAQLTACLLREHADQFAGLSLRPVAVPSRDLFSSLDEPASPPTRSPVVTTRRVRGQRSS